MKSKKPGIPARRAKSGTPAGKSTRPATAAGPQAPDPSSLTDDQHVVSRPDGYHWVALDGRQEFGPFESVEDALADMHLASDDESDSTFSESLHEAERDIGIADWIDPETGEPAEGQSPPHLERE